MIVQYFTQSRAQTYNVLGNILPVPAGILWSEVMFSDTDLCCVLIVMGEGAKKKKETRRKWAKQWFIDTEKYTHKKLLNELRMCEPNYYNLSF